MQSVIGAEYMLLVVKIRSLPELARLLYEAAEDCSYMSARKVEDILGVSREETDPSTSSAADNGLSLFKSIPFNHFKTAIMLLARDR